MDGAAGSSENSLSFFNFSGAERYGVAFLDEWEFGD